MDIDLTSPCAGLTGSGSPAACQLPTVTRRQRVSGRYVLLVGSDDARECFWLLWIERCPPRHEDVFNKPPVRLELGSVFLGVASADFCHGLYGSRPVLIADDPPVGVDAGHDEEAAIRLAIFPIAQVDHVALLAHAC